MKHFKDRNGRYRFVWDTWPTPNDVKGFGIPGDFERPIRYIWWIPLTVDEWNDKRQWQLESGQ